MRGMSLIELLVTMTLAITAMAIAIPIVDRMRQDGQVRGAAFQLLARCGWLRIAAVHRGANVALRVLPAGESWTAQAYVDGDGDGVRSADISAGRDPALGPPVDVNALFPGARFGFVPGCPLVDGTPVADGQNPVRIGSARMVVFSPDGASSGGTLYLRGGPLASGYAVVILGATGRTRLLRCLPGTGRWRVDGR